MPFSIFATDMIYKPIQIQTYTYIRDPRNIKEHFNHQGDSLVTQSLIRCKSCSQTELSFPSSNSRHKMHFSYAVHKCRKKEKPVKA